MTATLDERTYDPGDGAMGADHPISWWHAYDGGRAWYTALGHTDSTYSEPLFLSFLLGGIRYAAAPPTSTPLEIASLVAAVSPGRVRVVVRVTGCGACSGSARLGRASGKLRFVDGTQRRCSLISPPGTAGSSSSSPMPRRERRGRRPARCASADLVPGPARGRRPGVSKPEWVGPRSRGALARSPPRRGRNRRASRRSGCRRRPCRSGSGQRG